MHAANLLFGAGTFFATPNHADTYSPLMLLLHRGPSNNDHLGIKAAEHQDFPGDNASALDILSETPTMPSLEAMHQIAATNPRAQARFYLLMQELRPTRWFCAHLHCRFEATVVHGLQRSRDTLAARPGPLPPTPPPGPRTHFLALDKVVRGRSFLEFVDASTSGSPLALHNSNAFD